MEYKAEDIKTLDWKDHIRLRPGMYIGNLFTYGFWNMILYIIQDSISKTDSKFQVHIKTKNKVISIFIESNNTELQFKYLEKIEIYLKDSLFGIPVILALSKESKIEIIFNQKKGKIISQNGIINNVEYASIKNKKNSTFIEFEIDDTLMQVDNLNFDYLCNNIQKFAYSAKNISFICEDIPTNQLRKFYYQNGIKDLFNLKNFEFLNNDNHRLYLTTKINEYEYMICINLNGYKHGQPNITYANNHLTIEGGSLENGIKKGVISAVQKYKKIKKEESNLFYYDKKYYLKYCLFIVAQFKGENINYAGSTKDKIEMPKIEKDISNFIYEEVLKYLTLTF